MAGLAYFDMKFYLILIVLTFSANTLGQVRYSTYTNQRFSFSIEYPSGLLQMQPPPINGDGRIFSSADKTVEMRAWANYNATFLTVREQFEEDQKSYGSEITYKFLGKDKFAISGIKNGNNFYQETLYHKFKETDVFYTFTIEYPNTKREVYDPIVRRIAKTFRFDPSADV
jgi:hypothetical protein